MCIRDSYSKAEAWGCCSPLYFDVHVVAVLIDWFVSVVLVLVLVLELMLVLVLLLPYLIQQ